ncbi:MAG: acyl-CoA/acyl-ACP dehydrogenase [Acidobacteriota bacterium]|nr:acyl-CoA/acyl-ACP dehydrogenase [Acidobacteriota bacterium]
MQFGLSDTQQTLKTTARKFLAAECPMAEVRKLSESDHAFDAGLWRKIADQGWTGILFDEQYGGSGMSMVDMAAVLEEMGRALTPGPYLSTALLAGPAIERAGDDAASRKYLSAICSGEAKATLAMLEEHASWSPHDVKMSAKKGSSGYTLSGSKLFVPDAGVADLLVCAAKIGQELAIFVIPAKTPGLRIERMPAIDSTRPLYAVTFENAGLPAESLLAQGERAHAALHYALNVATTGLVAEMVGGMQRLLDITVEYAKTRKQFGKPIGQFQAVQHQCADMLVFTESSRSAAYYAAWALSENGADANAAVSVAKAYASDAYREVGNRAIQVHGGMGFTWENDIHLFYRRAKASEIAFGDATWHRERIAKAVIDVQGQFEAKAAESLAASQPG